MQKKRIANRGIAEAVRIAGNQYRLAEILNVSQPHVWYMLYRTVSAERAVQIEKLLGVPRSWIRPDIFTTAGQSSASQVYDSPTTTNTP